MSRTKQELQNTKVLVRNVLESEKRARNSDKYLIWHIWRNIQHKDLNRFEKFKEVHHPRSIIRVRQEIQNQDGMYLPTDPDVIKKRRIKEKEIRDYYGEMSKPYQELQE